MMDGRAHRRSRAALELLARADALHDEIEKMHQDDLQRHDETVAAGHARLALGKEHIAPSLEVGQRMRYQREADRAMLEAQNSAMRTRVACARAAASAARAALTAGVAGAAHSKQHGRRPEAGNIASKAASADAGRTAVSTGMTRGIPATAAPSAGESIDAADVVTDLKHLRRELWRARADVKQLREREVALQGVVVALLPPKRTRELTSARAHGGSVRGR